MKKVTEESATIIAELPDAVSKEMEVFYNPVMKLNRDMSVLLLQALEREEMLICDPMAGSGIRAIRFLKELPEKMIKELVVNDLKQDFHQTFEDNLKLSKINSLPKKVRVETTEASRMLLHERGFDYVDIDPFGSPNPFLDSACKRMRRESILAVTATDTAPLCGTYPKACARKYWAKPRRDYLMHEYGIRILIRKCQLIGAQYDKALTPIFSYSLDHYFRIFFLVSSGKKKVDDLLKQHQSIDGFGPLWTGTLWDASLVKKMIKKNKFSEHEKFLEMIQEEMKIETVGFYDVHELSRELKLLGPPKHEKIMEKIVAKGFKVARTHFSKIGIKSDIDKVALVKLIND